MRLNETEMVKLLPAWMQEDGSDKGLADGCDIISCDAYARLKLLSRWDKIDQLNDAELDEMAWELNIQWYDSTAPIAVTVSYTHLDVYKRQTLSSPLSSASRPSSCATLTSWASSSPTAKKRWPPRPC